MAGTVLGFGIGVFIIALIWVLALVFGMIVLRAFGQSKIGVVSIFLLALIITVILVFYPTSTETTSPFKEIVIVDTFFIGRYVLLSVASLFFLFALFMLLPLHFLEPVYAKRL